ncbi:MAG: zinc-binding dehydrogenase [Candidatus Omnitrophota bacterium]
MKAAVTEGQGDIKLVEVPMPETGPYQCLCKTIACATCTGTDQKIIGHKLPWYQDYPGIVGHESIGQVIKTGNKVRNIKEGELVFRPTAVYQGEKLGDYYSLWGGFAEYGLVTDGQALQEDFPKKELHFYVQFQMKLPRNLPVSPTDATMLITLKETAGFVMSLKSTLNTSLVILGTGAVGMSMCFFAKLIGAYPIIVIGRRDEALERMKKFGANFLINNQKEDITGKVKEYTDGKGVELVIDTAGDEKLLSESVGILSETGKVAVYATFETSNPIQNLDQNKIAQGVTGEVQAQNYMCDLVRLNLIPLKDFYSHQMPFSEIVKGFEMLKKKEAFKIAFEMGDA